MRLLKVTLIVACASGVTGCGVINKIIRQAGEGVGTDLGIKAARAQAAPKATVIVKRVGGPFCEKLKVYRFPDLVPTLSDTALDSLSPGQAKTLDDIDADGEKNCPGWR